jgi:hypothetical protein
MRVVHGAATSLVLALGLVVVGATGRGAEAAHRQATPSVIDRTYSCATDLVGGIRSIEVRAHAGVREKSEWTKLSYAMVSSGGPVRTPWVDRAPENSLAWVSGGKPSPEALNDEGWLSFTVQLGGTVGVSRDGCTPVKKRLRLSRNGLVGGAVGTSLVEYDCEVPRRVLVRVRAIVDGGAALRHRGELFLRTYAPARLARIGVSTPSGRLLAFGEVTDKGRAALFVARGCTRE